MATAIEVKKKKTPGIIKKLDETVVNRIAAGEVIQRPANALKELIENCLDAGAANINITVKSGGLKLLQIQDDGSGIRKEDLAIVCERFTTSKLQSFEDLEEIATYGFRGEALASISHVAHLTVISKTEGSPCAYRAEYTDGALKVVPNAANPKPCAGNQGTIIIVEDLFYNMETRKRALKSTADEYTKIVDVTTRYAIHNAHVGFSVKKETGMEFKTSPMSTTIDNIRQLYSNQISRELVEVKFEDESNFKLHGYVSSVNFSQKRCTFLLFINHRLVDSTSIRKAIESLYSSYLPKGTHPFLYLSLEINPRNVDVNVHPTKHEVHFLHEEAVVKSITNAIEKVLLGSNESRLFFVQSVLPGTTAAETATVNKQRNNNNKKCIGEPSSSQQSNNSVGSRKNTDNSTFTYQKDMVRTDKNLQKLDKFITSTPSQHVSKTLSDNYNTPSNENRICPMSAISKVAAWETSQFIVPTPVNLNSSMRSIASTLSNCSASTSSSSRRREMRLRTVSTALDSFKRECHSSLLSILRNHIFVGCVDRTRALIQYDTKLYMVNTSTVTKELFYQKLFHDFGNFGRINLTDPKTIKEHVLMSLDHTHPDIDMTNREAIADDAQNLLISKAKMLDDYFMLLIDKEGYVHTIPLLLGDYFPCMDFFPLYLYNLASKVVWTNEVDCFKTFAQQTATFYAVQPGGDTANNDFTENENTWKWTIEHVVYPELKKCIIPPKLWTEDATVIQLADLPDLYKVFERC